MSVLVSADFSVKISRRTYSLARRQTQRKSDSRVSKVASVEDEGLLTSLEHCSAKGKVSSLLLRVEMQGMNAQLAATRSHPRVPEPAMMNG